EIAMNLHDDLGQKLTALKMNLSWLRKRIGVQSALVSDKLDEVENIIKSSIGTVQKISSELRPAILYELGLKDAVEWHMKQNLEPAGIKGSFRMDPEDLMVDKESSIVLFRIIQEAVTNIIRHSGAKRADIRLSRFLSYIELVIRDNGRGIKAGAVNDLKSFGLTSIRERVKNISGQFRITGEKGKGTLLVVRIPYIKTEKEDDQDNNNR
ncbi:MAG: sensor histidine kinase, partial [Bacteroidales bacterium]|nr:sensor histidine kinase [Bacteroidales bacterium]